MGDGHGQAGRDDVLGLAVGRFFCGAEQAVAGVADNGVGPARLAEGAAHEPAGGGTAEDLQYFGDEVSEPPVSRQLVPHRSRAADNPYRRRPGQRTCPAHHLRHRPGSPPRTPVSLPGRFDEPALLGEVRGWDAHLLKAGKMSPHGRRPSLRGTAAPGERWTLAPR
jgi:hypothetical protein